MIGVFVTVLAVDDEPATVEYIRRVLERHGFKVLSATSADEAVRMFQAGQNEIGLLVTDVLMPDVNGPELAERLRALKPKIGVLYVSGFLGQCESLIRGRRKAPALAKPFTPGSLIREVEKVLAKAGR